MIFLRSREKRSVYTIRQWEKITSKDETANNTLKMPTQHRWIIDYYIRWLMTLQINLSNQKELPSTSSVILKIDGIVVPIELQSSLLKKTSIRND